MYLKAHLCVDSKDLLTSLSTQLNLINRSISGDGACILSGFQIENVERIMWIPCNVKLADVVIKKNSPLSEALQLTLFTGRLNLSIENVAETKSTEKQLG